MGSRKRQKNNEKKRLGMRGKLIISLLCIAVMLVVSFAIAVFEYIDLSVAGIGETFYRAVMPVFISLLVGLLLIAMLLFFLLSYYVNPVYRMLSGLDSYRSFGKKYSVTVDGEDQIAKLNEGVLEITQENEQLRHRIAVLKGKEPRQE